MWVHRVNPNFGQTNHRVSLHHLHFGFFTFLAIIVVSLNCASARSTWVCSTCVQGAIYIDRNTLQNIHSKLHIGSSLRRGVNPAVGLSA